MSNITCHAYHGELVRRPHPGKPSVALARTMPLSREEDFAVFTELPDSDVPIYLNFTEHFGILADMVTRANQLWNNEITLLVRISMPSGMRLPAPLLSDNVLLMQDTAPEEQKLKDSGHNVLVIHDFFARYQLDNGKNRIDIRLYSQNDDAPQLFSQFIEPLAELGVEAREVVL